VRDVLAYCGKENRGYLLNGRLAGHVWLRHQAVLIDFSVGDWRQAPSAMPGREIMQWSAPPVTSFFWAPAEPLMAAWRPAVGDDVELVTPPLGIAWYGPLARRDGDDVRITEMRAAAIEELKPHAKRLRDQIEVLRLPERVAARAATRPAYRLNNIGSA
jgi:hypothetical protein